MKYAEVCRVQKILKQYFEVLVWVITKNILVINSETKGVY